MKGQGTVVFLVVFTFGFLITIASPDLPPGRLIYNSIGLPDTTHLILDITGPTLGSAIFNGVIYGGIVWLIYAILQRGPRRKAAISKQQSVPKQIKEEIVNQYTFSQGAQEQKPQQQIPETIAYGKLNLTNIERIGSAYTNQLKDLGISTTDDLLEAGSTRKGRNDLSEQLAISPAVILDWVNLSDLARIRGVGEEYSVLLEAAGVDTVVELARRNPENLHTKILEVNEEENLVRRPPTLSQVQDWVEQAQNLPRKIEY